MKKRLLVLLLICIAGCFCLGFMNKDIDSCKVDAEYIHKTLLGNVNAINGLSFDVRTKFAPGDNWKGHLSFNDGKLNQSISYVYEDNDADLPSGKSIIGSVDINVGFEGLYERSYIEDSVGLNHLIYEFCSDYPVDKQGIIEIKPSDYYEYYPVQVHISPGNFDYSDKGMMERRAAIEDIFANKIKVPVEKEDLIKVTVVPKKDDEGKLKLYCEGVEYKRKDSSGSGALAVVTCGYSDIIDKPKGLIFLYGIGVYDFSFDINSVGSSFVEKIIDLEGDSAEVERLSDGIHYVIMVQGERSDRIYLYNQKQKEIVFEMEYQKSFNLIFENTDIVDEEDYLAIVNADSLLVFDKKSDGSYASSIVLSDLQWDENADIWCSLLSGNYMASYFSRVRNICAVISVVYKDGKLLIIRPNYLRGISNQTEYSFLSHGWSWERYVEVVPNIMLGVISPDGPEYIGEIELMTGVDSGPEPFKQDKTVFFSTSVENIEWQ